MKDQGEYERLPASSKAACAASHGALRADDASATPAHFPNQLTTDGGGELGKKGAIEDVLRLPKVPPGDYVLGFRCESFACHRPCSSCR